MQETQKLIVLNSITCAYRARDYLAKMGVRSYLERVPEHLRGFGCGYGVRVGEHAELAAHMLERAGIPVRDIIERNAW